MPAPLSGSRDTLAVLIRTCTFKTCRVAALLLLLLTPLAFAVQAHPDIDTLTAGASLMSRHNRAWLLSGRQRFDEAIPLLHAIIEEDKNFYRAHFTLAEAYQRKCGLDEGEAYFRSRLRQNSREEFAWAGLGHILNHRNQYGEAAECYARCVDMSPTAYPCYRGLASAAGYDHLRGFGDRIQRATAEAPAPYADFGRWAAHMIRGERQAALAAARRALDQARALGNDDLTAMLHLTVSSCLGLAGEGLQEIIEHIEAAHDIYGRIGDLEQQFVTAGGGAAERALMGNKDAARAAYEGSIRRSREAGLRYEEFWSLLWYSGFLEREGQLESAREYLQEALRVGREIGSMQPAPGILMHIGSIYREQGLYAEAVRHLQESLDAAQQARAGPDCGQRDFRSHEAFVLRELASIRGRQGEHFLALRLGAESVKRFRDIGQLWQAGAGLGVLGRSYAALGDFVSARSCFEQSLASARKFNDTSQQQSNLNSLAGLLLRMDRPRDAVALIRDALVLAERTRWEPFRLGNLLNLGIAQRQLGKGGEALSALLNALGLAQSLGIVALEAAVLVELGDCHLQAGSVETAEDCFRKSLEIAERAGPAEIAVSARRGLAAASRSAGNLSESLTQLDAAVGVLETLRSRIPSAEIRSGFTSQNWKVFEDTLDAMREIHDLEKDPERREQYARRAFACAEQGRARSFLEMLQDSGTVITKGLTAAQNSRHQLLQAALDKARAALRSDSSEKNRRAFEQSISAMSEWARDVAEGSEDYRRLQFPAAYSAAMAQSALKGSGKALLEYALGATRSYAWLITGDQFVWATLPPRDAVEREVRAYRRIVARHPSTDADFEAFKSASGRLYRWLVSPFRSRLRRGGQLLIVPDGILHNLAFETLAPTDAAAPLLEQFTIAYAPSASVFGNLQTRSNPEARTFPKRELLAFGAPDFGSPGGTPTALPIDAAASTVRAVYQRSGVHFSPLPHSAREIRLITAQFGPGETRTYLGREATESAVKREALRDYRRIHFATHAILDSDFPARSGMVLSLVGTGGEDGILRLAEIFNLDMDADLVVLSACRTGLGKLVRGEGVVGLTRAFMYAGSPRVVVSLWEVNDAATAQFMNAFYRSMRRGEPASVALRSAKLDMLRSAHPVLRHPYFWAPFVLSGLF